jgi:hypothetical protein
MFCQNDQIHNNLYLVVWNCNEIGKVYQVIEKWVFFKLLFANLTDSSGGKNHNCLEICLKNYFKIWVAFKTSLNNFLQCFNGLFTILDKFDLIKFLNGRK